MIKHIIISCFVLVKGINCSAQQIPVALKKSKQEVEKIKKTNIKNAAKIQFQYFIVAADSTSFGYNIYADGNLYIQQKTVPAVAGNKGFADTTSAGKTARLVIKKIRNGDIPPSVTVSDLKKLNILSKN